MKLKILSYNIHKGLNWNNTQLILDPIKKLVQKLEIDIIFFQEVSGENLKLKNKFENYPIQSQFEFFADSIWNHYSYAQNSIYDHGHHGNLILSKYPITRWENINISTNRWEKRGLLYCKIEIPDKKLNIDLLCTHLNLFHSGRKKQYNFIKEFINKNLHPDSKVILSGDFNDWNLKSSLHLEELDGFSDAFYSKNNFFAKTFPSFLPILCLDRIYTKNFKIDQAEVLGDKEWRSLSDHLPLYAQMEIV